GLDEEADERPVSRPRRKQAKQAARNTPLILGLVAGGVLLVGVAVTLAVVYWPFGKAVDPVTGNNPVKPGPVVAAAGDGVVPAAITPPAGGQTPAAAAGRRVFE